jgi:uncharacterized damage-inducible protein DinB
MGARWAEHQREMDAFVSALTSTRLADVVGYANTAGVHSALPLWQIMVHVVNHGTHHRSELADMLTRLGSPPPAMDLLVYYRALSASPGLE